MDWRLDYYIKVTHSKGVVDDTWQSLSKHVAFVKLLALCGKGPPKGMSGEESHRAMLSEEVVQRHLAFLHSPGSRL